MCASRAKGKGQTLREARHQPGRTPRIQGGNLGGPGERGEGPLSPESQASGAAWAWRCPAAPCCALATGVEASSSRNKHAQTDVSAAHTVQTCISAVAGVGGRPCACGVGGQGVGSQHTAIVAPFAPGSSLAGIARPGVRVSETPHAPPANARNTATEADRRTHTGKDGHSARERMDTPHGTKDGVVGAVLFGWFGFIGFVLVWSRRFPQGSDDVRRASVPAPSGGRSTRPRRANGTRASNTRYRSNGTARSWGI